MKLSYALYAIFFVVSYSPCPAYAADKLDYDSCERDILSATKPQSRKLICAAYIKGHKDGSKLAANDGECGPGMSCTAGAGSGLGGTFDVASSTQVYGVLSGISGTVGDYGPNDLMTIRVPANWQEAKQNGDLSWAVIAGNNSELGTKIKQTISIPTATGEEIASAIIPEFESIEDWAKQTENPNQLLDNLENFVTTLPPNKNGYVLTLRDSD